jgi:hypothetical protein
LGRGGNQRCRPCKTLALGCLLAMASLGAWAQNQQEQPNQQPTQNQQPAQPDQQPAQSNQPPAQSNPQHPQQENTQQNQQGNPQQSPQENPQQNQPQQNQPQNDQPPTAEKKNDNSNPATQLAVDTEKLGQATLDKLRDWDVGWFTGPYIGKNRELVALTARQRQEIYLQQTLTTPSAYFKRMFAAGIDQARDVPWQWGQGWEGYGERFASREGQFIASNSLAALGDAALHYEPRYDQCKCSGFRLRTRHALVRSFLTYNQTEREWRPQWALFGGAFAGGVISTTWKPHPRSELANGSAAVSEQIGYGALLNFFTEFAGEINRKIGARKR